MPHVQRQPRRSVDAPSLSTRRPALVTSCLVEIHSRDHERLDSATRSDLLAP